MTLSEISVSLDVKIATNFPIDGATVLYTT